jgi:hypothetical protein
MRKYKDIAREKDSRFKGYLYPISYPKIAKKENSQSLFWAGYVEGYDILILGISF